MDLSILFSIVIVGLAMSMLLFMISSGLTLVFGVLRVINFAHGTLYMLGAYVGLSLQTALGGTSFWIPLILSAVIVAIVGAAIEILLLRRIYKAEHIYQLLLTYSLVLVLDGIMRIIWGLDSHALNAPGMFVGSIEVVGRNIPLYSIFVIAAGFVFSYVLWNIMNKTKFGIYIRAAVNDVDITNALGINVPLIFTGVFIVGSLLAGLAGMLAAPMKVISPDMGAVILIECFAVVIIGGLGSLTGALVGSLLIGMLTAFGNYFVPGMSMGVVYLIMAGVLVFKPTGLFGEQS